MALQPRVILWGHPRCTSTAFLCCMDNISKCRAFFEPYMMAYYFGPDRACDNSIGEGMMIPLYSYRGVQEALEDKFEDDEIVFVKDMAFSMDQDHYKYLASGYQHIFVIRHPAKSISSLYKMYSAVPNSPEITLRQAGYEPMYKLVQHVREQLGQEVVIIDSDELCDHPEKIFPQFCEKVGIAYRESMLSWPPLGAAGIENKFFLFDLDDERNKLTDMMKKGRSAMFQMFHANSMASTGFKKSFQTPAAERPTLPDNVQKMVEESLPFYDALYQQRIKP